MCAAVSAGGSDVLCRCRCRCRFLLTSLSAAALNAQSFRARWTSVSAAVARLSSSLDDLAPLPVPPNPLVADLLQSLTQILSPALALASLCRSSEPPASRLRTQSEIDAVSAALHQLATDADLILRSGVFTYLPSPPPEAGSSRRELVRTEARSLVTRLQIGSSESRIAALDSLLDLLRQEEKNVVVAAGLGVVPALVRLLDSVAGAVSCHVAREKAAAAIARISEVQSCHHLIVAEGLPLLHHLARILESEGGAAKEKTCTTLQILTQNRDNAVIFGSRGGIAALLKICRNGSPSAQAAAAAVLKNLATAQELRLNILEENAIPALIGLLASGTPLAQENVIGCLSNLSAGAESESIKLSIFKEGALECLKNYWETVDRGEDRNLELGVCLLRNLASFRYIAEIIATTGFLLPIITALESDHPGPGTRTEAARAVAELALVLGRTRKEFEDAVPPLVRMLEARAMEEKEAALRALASLMSFLDCQRLLRKEEKGIVNVVQLLDPLIHIDKKYSISILVSISQSRKCRKQMVAAGAYGYLQRLSVMEVDGAKKLLANLGRGKILGVFPRT